MRTEQLRVAEKEREEREAAEEMVRSKRSAEAELFTQRAGSECTHMFILASVSGQRSAVSGQQ